MTITQLLKQSKHEDSDILLGHVLKQPKEFLFIHGDQKISKIDEKKFKDLLKKRLSGIPTAYLLGYKYFYGLKFKVNRNVLIPRPESEWLADESLRVVVEKLKSRKTLKNMQILEIGTGSGCIAISIAKTIQESGLSKKVRISASDISAQALVVAKQNAKLNKVSINFAKRDLLTGAKGKYDLIIANLPYIPMSDYQKLLTNLKYEPKLALTDGTDEFVLIKNLLSQTKKHLNKNGVVLLEIDPKAKSIIKKLYTKAEIIKDIHKLDRFVRIG